MGFDDLARHMASRDGKKGSASTDPAQMLAEAAQSARRMQRMRDLILGPILLVGGIVVGLLAYSIGTRDQLVVYLGGAALLGIAAGGGMLARGVFGKHDGDPDKLVDKITRRWS